MASEAEILDALADYVARRNSNRKAALAALSARYVLPRLQAANVVRARAAPPRRRPPASDSQR